MFKVKHKTDEDTPVFFGLDISVTSSGVSIIDIDGCLLNIFRIQTGTELSKKANLKKFTKVQKYDRYKYISDVLSEEFNKYKNIKLICIEECFVGFIKSAIPLIELATVTRSQMYFKGHSFFTVMPTKIKKFLCGKGNVEKEAIPKEVYKRWGVDTNFNDEADSYVMAQFARSVYCYDNNIDIGLMKRDIAIVKDIKKDKATLFFNYEN